LHRILRLTPSLAMVALLSATLITHMGSGPFWPAMYVTFQESCEKNWWSTVTYLQNYVHTHNQCVGQAWYLAVDTQMYFLSPVVLFPLLRWPKQTIGAIGVFVVLNCAYVFEISLKKQLGATFFSQDQAQYAYIYSPTHVRGTVYLIGMVCGYFIFQTKSKRLELRKSIVALSWVLSLLVLTGIVFAHSSFNAGQYTVLEGALFNSFSRVCWSGALCVVILLCVNGYGGVVNSFLSSNVFTVLIRLNYNVYLLHLLVIGEVVGQGRTPIHFSNLVGFHSFWGNYAFSLGAAVVWTLAFESPVLVIEKIVFGQSKFVVMAKNELT
jgi:peptidoglycan/LPS O-acetylase OafA/YrhL